MADKSTVELKEDEMIVSKEKLGGILQRLEELEGKAKRNEMKIARPVNEKTCTVMFMDDKPLIEFGGFSKDRNKMGEEQLWVDVFLQDGEKKVKKTVLYVDMLRDGDRRKGFIVDIDPQIRTTEVIDSMTGVPQDVEKKYVDNYRTVGTRIRVPVIVESVYRVYKVRMDGSEEVLTIPEEVINI